MSDNANDPLAGAALYTIEDFFGFRWVEILGRDVETMTRADVVARLVRLAESYENAPKVTGKGSRNANRIRAEWAAILRKFATGHPADVPIEVVGTQLSVGRRIGGRAL